MEQIMELLPLIIPALIIQLVLEISAIVHLVKNKKVRFLNIPIWLIIIVFINIIGPILYFVLGREEA